ncbi:hypothetical protein Y032_0541g3194 [Ancylostoma ceylanicum]|uniref:Uncharacterized protein n=1 Tax=Ancylostoma ceylanicum TaxID=53326 RepID=A0A016WR74_9BILA|nr:hypothetical protein Y032_0541g3194 [Ancylostoma ceylanicum]
MSMNRPSQKKGRSCYQRLNSQGCVRYQSNVFEGVKCEIEVYKWKRLLIHNLFTSLQVLRLALGEARNCRLHPFLLNTIVTSVPMSREAGKCETRRRRVAAFVLSVSQILPLGRLLR